MNAYALQGIEFYPSERGRTYGVHPQLGCACEKRPFLGAVADYDIIMIGGEKYSASELYAKAPTLFAEKSDVRVYSNPSEAGFKYITKKGNPIGKYTSYLLPKAGRPDAWVELQTGPSTYVYVRNEALSSGDLKEQGVATVEQQVKEEQDRLAREADPVGYYLKKFGLPALLIGGGIYLAATYGKELIKGKILKAA